MPTDNLPPLSEEFLAEMGAAIGTAPIRPAPGADFGIIINKPEPEVEHQLTPDDCMKLFGKRESVMMHFIPQMLTALALEQAEALIDYCRQHRLSEYKRHNREIRRCIDEHNFELRKSYGSAWNAL